MPSTCPHCSRSLAVAGDAPRFCPYCGMPLASTVTTADATAAYQPSADQTDPFSAPTVPRAMPGSIGGYRVVRELGQGGMGTVYEAVDLSTEQPVAIKVLSHPVGTTPASIERFRQEGKLASLLAHPRCVFVLAADEEAGLPYIVMELMPGTTLKDRVLTTGPLSPREAIFTILDVIEGLQEAHRQNILHRDVKPSNCFLMPDGRVKVGDFGLSKSLAANVNLTQTGSFLGTVLYASPEQIRGEPLDFASDVYSVAATLYFLLTGRAPHQHDNPTAVISKVISEPAPPMRRFNRGVPRDLECVVLRGLERDRTRRYPTLGALRTALEQLLPFPLTRSSQGVRFAAMAIDALILLPLLAASAGIDAASDLGATVSPLLFHTGVMLYFALFDGLAGGTPGKQLMRLRTCAAGVYGRAGLRSATGRALLFWLLAGFLPDDLLRLTGRTEWASGMLLPTIVLLGWIAMLAPMRRGTGYRGLHELLSGTQVMQLPWPQPASGLRPPAHRPQPDPRPVNVPASLGGFQVEGVWVDAPDRALLHAKDTALGREVHLLIDADSSSVSGLRRTLVRPARARWLGSGPSERGLWNAFLAPHGFPLAALVTLGRGLRWTEAFRLLDQLSEELQTGLADATLPRELHLHQVWLLPDGRAQLLDYPLPPGGAGEPTFPPNERGSLAFLREVAIVALEGGRRDKARAVLPVRAILPLHAAPVVERLVGTRAGYWKLDEFRKELDELRSRPAEVTTPLRLAHLGIQAIALSVGIGMMLAYAGLFGAFLYVGYQLHFTEAVTAVTAITVPPPGMSADEAAALTELLEKRAERIQLLVDDHTSRGMNGPERALANVWDKTVRMDGHKTFSFADNTAEYYSVAADQIEPTFTRPLAMVTSAAVLLFWPAVWVMWAFVWRGGASWPLAGLAVVRDDGRPAPRWRCAWRAGLVWLPFVLLLAACVTVKTLAAHHTFLHTGLWWAAVVYLAATVLLALARPGRGVHDRLAGTYVVPA